MCSVYCRQVGIHSVVWVLPCLYGVFGNGFWWGHCLCSLVIYSTYKQPRQDKINELKDLIHYCDPTEDEG